MAYCRPPLVVTAVLDDEEMIRRVAMKCGNCYADWSSNQEMTTCAEDAIRAFIQEYRKCPMCK